MNFRKMVMKKLSTRNCRGFSSKFVLPGPEWSMKDSILMTGENEIISDYEVSVQPQTDFD